MFSPHILEYRIFGKLIGFRYSTPQYLTYSVSAEPGRTVFRSSLKLTCLVPRRSRPKFQVCFLRILERLMGMGGEVGIVG